MAHGKRASWKGHNPRYLSGKEGKGWMDPGWFTKWLCHRRTRRKGRMELHPIVQVKDLDLELGVER